MGLRDYLGRAGFVRLLLQKQVGVEFPLGHLHTPALSGHDAKLEGEAVDQARRIIAAALS